VYALGLALAAYGLAAVTYGNGLIAAFVAGVALGVAEHDIPKAFSEFNESVSAILQVGVFFVFGALIVATGWDHGVPALVGFIVFALVLARPLAVLAALAGTRLASPLRLFIAWFGPKGVASMLFALLVLKSRAPHSDLVFEIASFAILSSIVAHGLTDTIGARWIERRLLERRSAVAS
jgi:NhaP-type Na+/H+ and K+/H+ antiporter